MPRNIADCVKKKGVNADEVIFLYTTSCCSSIDNTVMQLGAYKFRKYEVGISITSNEKDILDCLNLNISEAKNLQAAEFWCPGTGEELIITKDKFIGAKDTIRNFSIQCTNTAKQ